MSIYAQYWDGCVGIKIEKKITIYSHYTDCTFDSLPAMIFTTQLELNITIKDINAIYATNYEQMLIDHARQMYERKCRDGQYIKSIDRLVKRSLPNLIRRDLDAKVRVYIVVEATAIRYDQYDFITGMTIQKVIPAGKIGNFDLIECRNDHVVSLMRIQQGVEMFKVGDMIPIRAGASMYKIGNEHILVNGVPFLPYVPERVQYSLGALTPGARKYFFEMIKPLIDREVARKSNLDQDRWNSIASLIYPYKKNKKVTGLIDLSAIDSIQNGLFSADHHADLSQLKIATSAPSSVITVAEDEKGTLMRLAFPFVKWIGTINDLVEQYPTDDDYNRLGHVWDLYVQHKLT